MGLSVRDDPKKVVDIGSRTWGEAVDGLALSLQLKPKEDADQLPAVSVAIQNSGGIAIPLKTRGWLDFYRVSATDAAGAPASPTPYGQELGKHQQQLQEVVLLPGKAIEADIPIGLLYRMDGRYRVSVSCETPGGSRVVSNAIEVNA